MVMSYANDSLFADHAQDFGQLCPHTDFDPTTNVD